MPLNVIKLTSVTSAETPCTRLQKMSLYRLAALCRPLYLRGSVGSHGGIISPLAFLGFWSQNASGTHPQDQWMMRLRVRQSRHQQAWQRLNKRTYLNSCLKLHNAKQSLPFLFSLCAHMASIATELSLWYSHQCALFATHAATQDQCVQRNLTRHPRPQMCGCRYAGGSHST